MTYKYNFYRKTRSASLGHARHELSESGAAIGRNRWQPLVPAAMHARLGEERRLSRKSTNPIRSSDLQLFLFLRNLMIDHLVGNKAMPRMRSTKSRAG
jgi:hypothetical protein